MKKAKTEYQELFLHGYKIHIYPDVLKIFNLENIPFDEFKAITDKLVRYMMDEAFIEKKKIKIDVVVPQ
jgi:hypothetical protein